MTDWHGVPSNLPNSHDRYASQILAEIEAVDGHSQRALATNSGHCAGADQFARAAFRAQGLGPRDSHQAEPRAVPAHPRGVAEKARMSRLFLQESVRFYASARDRVRESLTALAAEWPPSETDSSDKRIVFFGTGEVAEIAYVCL